MVGKDEDCQKISIKQTPDFMLEHQYDAPIAGVDEAGRGPWAGPVVAAAVILPHEHESIVKSLLIGLNDSKKLSVAKRTTLYRTIIQHYPYGVGIVDVATIDRINILQATLLAMQQAVEALPVAPNVVLVDGNRAPALSCRAVPVIQGDALSLSIAAASVVAKVTRDAIMHNLHMEYPCYGWDKNAGYGVKAHQEGLVRYGVTPHHRLSFKPIQHIMSNSLHKCDEV